MELSPSYPTPEHARAAQAIVAFFATRPAGVDAVLLTNSCARGRATRDSCLDIVVLVSLASSADRTLAQGWARFYDEDAVFTALRQAGRFSVVHLDFFDGSFRADRHPDDEFPDAFEVEIGNYLVYSVPLWEHSGRFERLRARWLPYYDEERRSARLTAVRRCCRDCLEHVPSYVERGLYFAAFDRLYRAFQIFLQGLFIARRIYPIAYNKWIREQVAEILGLPELYERLPSLLEIGQLESRALIGKAEALEDLLDRYIPISRRRNHESIGLHGAL